MNYSLLEKTVCLLLLEPRDFYTEKQLNPSWGAQQIQVDFILPKKSLNVHEVKVLELQLNTNKCLPCDCRLMMRL